jgi:tRNA threonylcarbamoyladenosine biosynthesis protein TsaE
MVKTAHMALQHLDCVLEGETATQALATHLAHPLTPGFRLYLSGGLGAGKTTLARALLRALGVQGRIKSPTFSLLEPYNLPSFELHHYDFYRLDYADAWRDAGFESSFDSRTVVVVEWPEQAGGTLPVPDLWIDLHLGRPPGQPATDTMRDPPIDECRWAELDAYSEDGRRCLRALIDAGCCSAAPSPASGCAQHGSLAPS